MKKQIVAALFLLSMCISISGSFADPCGMVPPVYLGNAIPITRIGHQMTYVFYKDGTETFVIRPGFRGNVDEFGMLIPFPTVPEIRKVPDNIFPHIAAAIDPPEVVIDVRNYPRRRFAGRGGKFKRAKSLESLSFKADKDSVKVIKEEAVGMYEVAVLAAGSAKALKKWLDDHGFQYPKGMDKPCNDYVNAGWCFVAVKTKVGQKKGVDPKPGMRKVNSKLPDGSTFDGHVQAMGFRFKVDKLVLPMRLSAFNKGELHNIVYVLADKAMKIRSVPEEYVVRQIPGSKLRNNITQPLPLRIIGGTVKDIQLWQKQNLKQRRNPVPHNGSAKDLFAGDLLAVKEKRLSHPHEEKEKMLLRIGESLGLRGPEIDKLNLASMEADRQKIVKDSIDLLKDMTLTVIDGNFPREVLANQNLTFNEYRMPNRRNSSVFYDARTKKAGGKKTGVIKYGAISWNENSSEEKNANISLLGNTGLWTGFFVIAFGFVWGTRRRGRKFTIGSVIVAGMILGFATTSHAEDEGTSQFNSVGWLGKSAANPQLSVAWGQPTVVPSHPEANQKQKKLTTLDLIDRLKDPKKAEAASKALIARGDSVVPDLIGEAIEGSNLALRGWSIVILSEIGGKKVADRFLEIQDDVSQPMLVRTWAAAGRVTMANSNEDLLSLATLIPKFPAIGRPIGLKLVANIKKQGDKASAEDILNITVKVPQLQQSLAPAILAMGANPLVKTMATARDQRVRRQAAAYLGTLATQGDKTVPAEVVNIYRFDPKAKRVAWNGGPLFIPGIRWEKKEARELVGNLIAWYVWCEENMGPRQRQKMHRQLHNNLQSIQLARVAGYRTTGFRNISTEQWLMAWSGVVGKDGIEKILDAQGLSKNPKYTRILNNL